MPSFWIITQEHPLINAWINQTFTELGDDVEKLYTWSDVKKTVK